MNRRKFIALLGGAAAWPVAARGQSSPHPIIGFMSGRSPDDSQHLVAAFREGLAETGFIDGQNVLIEFRWAYGRYDQLPALATDLLSRGVAILAGVGGDPSAIAAKKATSTIPVIFGIGGDPIQAGLVQSFNRPGGNATGYTLLTAEMEPKRLGLLRELIPGVSLVGVLLNPDFPPAVHQLHALEQAAGTLGQRLFVSKATNDAELMAALATFLKQQVNVLLIAADPYFDTQRNRIVQFAAQNRLSTIYQFREFAVAGGLMTYGPSIIDGYRQGGVYAGRILKGAKPADLPVLQPTKFELVINVKTAKVLGLDIPDRLLALADEVVE